MATEGWGARLLALQGEDGQWDGRRAASRRGASIRWRRPDRARGPALDRHAAHAPRCCVISGSTRATTGCAGRWRRSETTAVGSTPASRSSAARSSRASTAGPSPWASTSVRMSRASSPACWVSSSRTAGGTARRRTVPSARRSTPRSTSWKGCWRTSARPVARRNPSRRDAGARSTSSNGSCSGARAPARSSTRPGCNSRFRPAGTTTCCVPSSTSARPAIRRTRGWTKRCDLLRSKQQPDGTWLLENTHPGKVHFALEDGDGRPSRWNTLRALRVLRWYERSGG